MYPSINIPATNVPAVNIPAVNISTVTGKIYLIIENLTDIIEELNKDPLSADGRSSARTCGLEGVDGVSLEANGGGRGGAGAGRRSIGGRDGAGAGAGERLIGGTGGGAAAGLTGGGEAGPAAGLIEGETGETAQGEGAEGEGIEKKGAEGEGIEEKRAEEKRSLIDPPGKGPEKPKSLESQGSKDSDWFRYLNSNEGLELIRLESTRQSLLRAQGFLEEKKQALINLARSRRIGR
jgi:hypothetical protein